MRLAIGEEYPACQQAHIVNHTSIVNHTQIVKHTR